jgi:hypothetical protein
LCAINEGAGVSSKLENCGQKLEGLRLPPGLDPFDARSIPIHLPTVIAA